MTEPQFGKLIKAPEVAKIGNVSRVLVYKWAERGQLPHVRIECPGDGKIKKNWVVRFRRDDVQKFFEDRYRS
jgi:predicted DNA-binding transcriptional regulator AlpA